MNKLKNYILPIMNRCFVLYVGVFFILIVSINHQRVVFKTLDYLNDAPNYLMNFARSKPEVSTKLSRPSRNFLNALRYNKNLIKLFPESGTAHGAVGFSYYHLGEIDKAKNYYIKAIDLNPKLFGLYYNLGTIYLQLGDYALSADAFQKALNIDPKWFFSEKDVILPFALEDLSNPNDLREKSIAMVRISYAKAYKEVVLNYEKAKDAQAVLRAALNGIANAPEHKDFFYFFAGKASYELNSYSNAINFFQQCIILNPSYTDAYYYLDLIFQKLKLSFKAKQQFDILSNIQFNINSDKAKYTTALFYYVPVHSKIELIKKIQLAANSTDA